MQPGDLLYPIGVCDQVLYVFGRMRVHLDRPVPGEILKRLTYRPRRGLRPVKHVSEDGRLIHAVSVQGIYRLAESSAAGLETVSTGPSGEPVNLLPRKSQDIPTNMDPLF